MLSSTPVIVEPAGTFAATSNAISPRRLEGTVLVPEKIPAAPPALLFGKFSKIVLSLLETIETVAASALGAAANTARNNTINLMNIMSFQSSTKRALVKRHYNRAAFCRLNLVSRDYLRVYPRRAATRVVPRATSYI